MSWALGPGVVELPDGVRLRGRSLRRDAPPEPRPDWGLYLHAGTPPAMPWPCRWIEWPDFRLPRDRDEARDAFAEAHRRAAAGARVELACGGGRGRTGTALACLAQLGGVGAEDAVAWVRARYDARAVEAPWQRRYVRRFGGRDGTWAVADGGAGDQA